MLMYYNHNKQRKGEFTELLVTLINYDYNLYHKYILSYVITSYFQTVKINLK